MDDHQLQEHDTLVQSLWNAIFAGTRLQHVTDEDQRVFVLRSVIRRRQESKVIDTETGEVFRFPWTRPEFIDPIEGIIPGWPLPPETAKTLCSGSMLFHLF